MSKPMRMFEKDEWKVRVLQRDGEPWFVAGDVCRSLGVDNSRQAVSRLDPDEKAVISNDGNRGRRSVSIISEAGVYSLILSSRKPEAKAFKRWVVHEILPSVRKHGAYVTPDTINKILADPDFGIELLSALKRERSERQRLETEVEIQRQAIQDFRPVKQYVDKILESKDTLTTTQIAADYGLSANKLNQILHEERLQHKVGGQWILYADRMGQGFTDSATVVFQKQDGSTGTKVYTRWTQKGRIAIHEILQRRGIRAVMDTEE